MKVIFSVPDEGYSGNVSCTLNLISTFFFFPETCHILSVVIKHKTKTKKSHSHAVRTIPKSDIKFIEREKNKYP